MGGFIPLEWRDAIDRVRCNVQASPYEKPAFIFPGLIGNPAWRLTVKRALLQSGLSWRQDMFYKLGDESIPTLSRLKHGGFLPLPQRFQSASSVDEL